MMNKDYTFTSKHQTNKMPNQDISLCKPTKSISVIPLKSKLELKNEILTEEIERKKAA